MKIRLAAVALLLLVASGCHRDDKAEKLAALESAYHSGVFTREEYEAKRAKLLGPPAAPAAPAPVAVQSVAPRPPAAQPESAPVPASVPGRPEQPPVSTAPPPMATASVPPATPPARPAPSHAAVEEPEAAPTAGCEDAEYQQAGKEKGALERFYPAPVDVVKKAAEASLRSLDFTVQNSEGNDLEAGKRRHIGALIGAGGERVLLHFERSKRGNQTGTLVTGETRKRLVGRIAQKSWTNAVLAQIACRLGGR